MQEYKNKGINLSNRKNDTNRENRDNTTFITDNVSNKSCIIYGMTKVISLQEYREKKKSGNVNNINNTTTPTDEELLETAGKLVEEFEKNRVSDLACRKRIQSIMDKYFK